jgi:hypothetical protein
MNWTIEESLNELDGCGLVITDEDLIVETLEALGFSLKFSFKSDEIKFDENDPYWKGQ